MSGYATASRLDLGPRSVHRRPRWSGSEHSQRAYTRFPAGSGRASKAAGFDGMHYEVTEERGVRLVLPGAEDAAEAALAHPAV